MPVATFQMKAPRGLSYGSSAFAFDKATTISPITPSLENYNNGTHPSLSYSVDPALPAGLSLNPVNGEISGTPTEYVITPANHTITVSNSGGSTEVTISISISPVNYTWTGNAFPDTNWSNSANWTGGAVPTTTNSATFDSYCADYGSGCNATIDTNLTLNADIRMLSDYTGTITQDTGVTLTLGNNSRGSPNGIIQSGGSFVGGDSDITVDILELTGGTFTSTSGNLYIGYNAEWGRTSRTVIGAGVTFNHNNGTVILDPTGNNSAFRENFGLTLDQSWSLYNLEFDIDSASTYDGETTGNYLRAYGTSRPIEVANELHFRDGWGMFLDIDFYGTDVYFHCDAPTFDKCSDGLREQNNSSIPNHGELRFKGSTAQTYNYDAGADSWHRFVIDNPNGVTTSSTGDFSVAGLNIMNGSFSAPLASDFHLFRETDTHYMDNPLGFQIGATGTFFHNNSNVIISAERHSYGDHRSNFTFQDDATFYDLTINLYSRDATNGRDENYLDLEATITVLNDLEINDGRVYGNPGVIEVQGDYRRTCSQLTPRNLCPGNDFGNLTYRFTNGSKTILLEQFAGEQMSSSIDYNIDPGAGETVTLQGFGGMNGSGNDFTVSSGTFHIDTNSGLRVEDLHNNAAITCAIGSYLQYDGALDGTPGAGNNTACYGSGPSDVTFDPSVDWADFSGTSAAVTLVGVNVQIEIQIEVNHTLGSPVIQFRESSFGWRTLGDGATQNINILPTETLEFRTNGGSSGDQATITIRNVDNANAVVDTITATVP